MHFEQRQNLMLHGIQKSCGYSQGRQKNYPSAQLIANSANGCHRTPTPATRSANPHASTVDLAIKPKRRDTGPARAADISGQNDPIDGDRARIGAQETAQPVGTPDGPWFHNGKNDLNLALEFRHNRAAAP